MGSPSRGEGEVGHNQPVYSVSEIAGAIKRMVEDRFGRVRLRGELSGWKGAHSSGHAYFRIKDDGAVIDAVCWRGSLAKLGCKPEEGLEVVATGRITTYPGKSSYQIVVDTMEPAGVGALMALLEKRKKQLEAEGLFASERKKTLPFLPRVVGVVTSPTGAVIRDILHRIEARCGVHVLVWPVAVQGEGAAEQIAAAIDGFNKLPPSQLYNPPSLTLPPQAGRGDLVRPDVLIVARGGGSIEDLWAFNEEIVVRAAANSAIPLISAVGHETDTTLIDYAADRRAPTPTAAAEMAVPVYGELRQGVDDLSTRLDKAAMRLLEMPTQRLDDWSERLGKSLPAMLEAKAQNLALLGAKLQPRLLLVEVTNWQKRLGEWQERMNASFARALDKRSEKLATLSALLESLNYAKVLERGYALVRDGQGHVVSSAAEAKNAAELSITFKDGEIVAKT